MFEKGDSGFARANPSDGFFRLDLKNAYVTSERGNVEAAELTMRVTMPGPTADQEMVFEPGAPVGWLRGVQVTSDFQGTYTFRTPFSPEDQARLDGYLVRSAHEPHQGYPLKLEFMADGFTSVTELFVVPVVSTASFAHTDRFEVVDDGGTLYLVGNGTDVSLRGNVDWATQYRLRARVEFVPTTPGAPAPTEVQEFESWQWLGGVMPGDTVTGPVVLECLLPLNDGLHITMGDALLATLADTPEGAFMVTLMLVDILADHVVQSVDIGPLGRPE
ncbi:hypothetical protein [Nocardioides jishulii]|uniref:Uncharacterized protein n=1 Tax=Nocardioides jishulii TaxID=2575440 RepID=A0A4U2YTA2_9ACTN|nr:hypothetical protein [Nocardioides jishulii]QCX28351.1 hypothetical protein FCL41_13095 [Nocardioides jishulii]TKI64756.1 hypothetical protein FC770_06480 [Nocardioides jishulii]